MADIGGDGVGTFRARRGRARGTGSKIEGVEAGRSDSDGRWPHPLFLATRYPLLATRCWMSGKAERAQRKAEPRIGGMDADVECARILNHVFIRSHDLPMNLSAWIHAESWLIH